MPRVSADVPAKKSRKSYTARDYRKKHKRTQREAGMKYPGAGSKIGGAIGSVFGPAGGLLGSAAGGLLQNIIHKVTGFGDYTLPTYNITQNKLLESNDPPIVQNNGKEFIIRHREYIGDLYSGVAGSTGSPAPSPFKIQAFNINPGLSATFPWLANVASRFEEYSLEGMLFEYKSLYSDAAVQTGGSLGSVIMATSYNASKPLFQSKIEMENYEFAQSAKPSVSMCHPIECAPSQSVLSELYVRTNDQVIADQDQKMYDFGKFQIASQGIPCTGQALSLGEIWVTYQIKLLKPRISDYLDSGYARLQHEPAVQPSGGHPFDPNPLTAWSSKYDNIGVKIIDNDSFQLPLRSNARTYMLSFTCFDPGMGTSQNAAVGIFSANSPAFTNASVLNVSGFNNPSCTMVSGSVITSGTTYTCYFRTEPLAPGRVFAEVTLPSALGATLIMMKNLIINAVPDTV